MRYAASTQYYVHRKATWRRMYRDVAGIPSRYLGPELFPCSFTGILGKVKQLDCLTTLFQDQSNQDSRVFSFDNNSLYDLCLQPEWSPSIASIRHHVAAALAEQDGISPGEAFSIFDREFWNHLGILFWFQYTQRYGKPANGKEVFYNITNSNGGIYSLLIHPQWARSIETQRNESIEMLIRRKGLDSDTAGNEFDKSLWKQIAMLLLAQIRQQFKNGLPAVPDSSGKETSQHYAKEVEIDALLNSASPFFNDFMPAHQIITGSSIENRTHA
jgi:hypothetical protein